MNLSRQIGIDRQPPHAEEREEPLGPDMHVRRLEQRLFLRGPETKSLGQLVDDLFTWQGPQIFQIKLGRRGREKALDDEKICVRVAM